MITKVLYAIKNKEVKISIYDLFIFLHQIILFFIMIFYFINQVIISKNLTIKLEKNPNGTVSTPVNNNRKIIIVILCSFINNLLYVSSFKKMLQNLEPSKGGTGNKLNTIKYIFIKIKYEVSCKKKNGAETIVNNLKIIVYIHPITKLAAGPARAQSAKPTFLSWIFVKLYGLIGTGFAHPNPKNNKLKDPHKVKCLIGLSESLPSHFAVWSPNRYAT